MLGPQMMNWREHLNWKREPHRTMFTTPLQENLWVYSNESQMLLDPSLFLPMHWRFEFEIFCIATFLTGGISCIYRNLTFEGTDIFYRDVPAWDYFLTKLVLFKSFLGSTGFLSLVMGRKFCILGMSRMLETALPQWNLHEIYCLSAYI